MGTVSLDGDNGRTGGDISKEEQKMRVEGIDGALILSLCDGESLGLLGWETPRLLWLQDPGTG